MSDLITVTGVVGSDPRPNVTGSGLVITNFRLASTRRYFDRAKGSWENGETNWYSVAAFRQLATNVSTSISKGDRVIVHGRLKLRAWEAAGRTGLAVEIDADAIGHDLSWGVSKFAKVSLSRGGDAAPTSAETASTWAVPGEPTPETDEGDTTWATSDRADSDVSDEPDVDLFVERGFDDDSDDDSDAVADGRALVSAG